MHRTPTSVKILSILGILFAAYGFFGIVVAAAMLLGGSSLLGPNPQLAAMYSDPGYKIGTGIMLALSVLSNGLLLACSIGGLTLKPWARPGMLTYAWLHILQIVANAIFTAVYVVPLTLSSFPPNTPPAVRTGAMGVTIAAVVFGSLFGLIYPCCALFFYTRRNVIDAFNGIFPPSEDPEDDDYEDDRRYRDREDRDDYERGNDRITDRPRG